MTDADKLILLRSIVISAEIEAHKDHPSPTASSAIAWRAIGDIRRILVNDENKDHNLVMAR